MIEHIEREKIVRDFEECNSKNSCWTPQRVLQLIFRQPNVDVAPIRHGYWVEIDPHKDVEGWIECDYQCSICKEISWEGTNYCPHCGAKMDKED